MKNRGWIRLGIFITLLAIIVYKIKMGYAGILFELITDAAIVMILLATGEMLLESLSHQALKIVAKTLRLFER